MAFSTRSYQNLLASVIELSLLPFPWLNPFGHDRSPAAKAAKVAKLRNELVGFWGHRCLAPDGGRELGL
jgi:hypothetical protein